MIVNITQSFRKLSARRMNKNKPVVLFDIDYTLFDTANFKESGLLDHQIYKEVIEVLENLKDIAILGIFSEGDLDFQNQKLIKTDIKKYFNEIHTHIVVNKVNEIKRVFEKYKDSKIFLIDDKLSILSELKNFMPLVFGIWIKRGWFADNQKPIEGFEPDATVDNLQEIVKIIKNNLAI